MKTNYSKNKLNETELLYKNEIITEIIAKSEWKQKLCHCQALTVKINYMSSMSVEWHLWDRGTCF